MSLLLLLVTRDVDVTDSQSAYLSGIEWQYLYPDADIAVDGWLNETSGSTLYPSLDDEEVNDADYVWHQGVEVNDYFEVRLSDLTNSVGEGPISIEWRAEALVGGVTLTLKLELREGETVIASDEQTLSTSFMDYVYVLTQEQINNIGNWNSVTIRVTVTEAS